MEPCSACSYYNPFSSVCAGITISISATCSTYNAEVAVPASGFSCSNFTNDPKEELLICTACDKKHSREEFNLLPVTDNDDNWRKCPCGDTSLSLTDVIKI